MKQRGTEQPACALVFLCSFNEIIKTEPIISRAPYLYLLFPFPLVLNLLTFRVILKVETQIGSHRF